MYSCQRNFLTNSNKKIHCKVFCHKSFNVNSHPNYCFNTCVLILDIIKHSLNIREKYHI